MADKEEQEEAVYTKPTSQVDLEARLSDESDPPVYNASVAPDPFNEDGFVGVSPEYANAANETDEPLAADEGADQMAEEAFEAAYGDSSGEVSERAQEAHDKVTRDDLVGPDAPAKEEPATTETSESSSS